MSILNLFQRKTKWYDIHLEEPITIEEALKIVCSEEGRAYMYENFIEGQNGNFIVFPIYERVSSIGYNQDYILNTHITELEFDKKGLEARTQIFSINKCKNVKRKRFKEIRDRFLC